MSIAVEPSAASCGATVRGVDLTDVSERVAADLRELWLRHQVLAVAGSPPMSLEQFERFAQMFGPFGVDPYLTPIAGHEHVVELRREAEETSSIFAETWHSDWSFLPHPPAATMLYGIEVPPVGGDTLFVDQYAAYDALPDDLRRECEGRQGIHSARYGYSKQMGVFGAKDVGRSMTIITDDSAMATQPHPIVRVHPETGRRALFASPSYTIGVEGMDPAEGRALLTRLFEHQGDPAFVYRHRWEPGMLVIWDNRCVTHAATGGYAGHRRRMYRITVADRAA
jgi:taurine dioxygenase